MIEKRYYSYCPNYGYEKDNAITVRWIPKTADYRKWRMEYVSKESPKIRESPKTVFNLGCIWER